MYVRFSPVWYVMCQSHFEYGNSKCNNVTFDNIFHISCVLLCSILKYRLWKVKISFVKLGKMNPKRQRKSPDRFGNNKEKNDDELLDEAERSSSVTVVDASIETEVISHSEDITILTPGELIMYKKLCLLETTCKRIDSRLRDVEVQVNTNTKTALNKLDTAGLVEFGLPVKNEDNFNDLEFKLLNSDFENKLVCTVKLCELLIAPSTFITFSSKSQIVYTIKFFPSSMS